MNRREFITLLGGGAAWPLTLRAEQSSRIARIGNLSTANPRSVPFYQAFERKLRDLGHIEGQNIVFEYRNAEGEVDRLPDLAAELVRLDASIIVTSTAAATSAVKRSTSTIPILMVAINYDPIALGYVDNLARPGGNVTGLFFQHLGLLAKRFGLFKELLPSISRVAVFSDSFTTDQLEVVHTANQSAGVELQPIHLQNPPYDFENVFRLAARSSAQAIMVLEVCAHLSRPPADRTARKGTSIADELRISRIRGGRWPVLLRGKLLCHVPASSRVRGQNTTRHQATRPSH